MSGIEIISPSELFLSQRFNARCVVCFHSASPVTHGQELVWFDSGYLSPWQSSTETRQNHSRETAHWVYNMVVQLRDFSFSPLLDVLLGQRSLL